MSGCDRASGGLSASRCHRAAVIVLYRCSVLVIMSVVGCSGQSKPADLPTAPIVSQAAEDAVRTAIAEQFRIDASNIDMNKPLSEPPYKADELDLVELVMEIEERLDVMIPDGELDKLSGGKTGLSSGRITPSQLVTLATRAETRPKSKVKKP